eukprot:CAMPEP_0176427432 /NCGR_PEP_ID=MMETSP0127-20121128/12560_1 /TAXON_ID=938130 /ORGANISM="Platyophrya macrostoma, Strain WH" /LENGTH=819 /DNA_ID=CAMNT_0017808941 /DNA_START=113 /DNA_END=2572 /DNA_ORIENTATION=+
MSAKKNLKGGSSSAKKATRAASLQLDVTHDSLETPTSMSSESKSGASPVMPTPSRALSFSVTASTKKKNEKRPRSNDAVAMESSSPATTTTSASNVANKVEDSHKEHAGASSPPATLTVLSSAVIAPDPSGITCVALSRAEDVIAVARTNGSLSLYRLDMHQGVAHSRLIRTLGGREGRTIRRLAYTANDGALLAVYFSGQMVLFCPQTLSPMHVVPRHGGAIFDMCSASSDAGDHFVIASADGSWRQLHVTRNPATSSLMFSVDVIQTVPKITGSDRALCVAASTSLKMVVGGDDAGNVVAWPLTIPSADDAAALTKLPPPSLLWSSRIPKGFPMVLLVAERPTHDACGSKRTTTTAAASFTPCVYVGTTLGDVVLLSFDSGAVMRRFSQHKGPVCTLTQSKLTGAVYASGWHESLRSYVCSDDGEWFPAEVKRRTHYHEASQILVTDKHQLLLSASKDGTIMMSPLATVFSSPAQYVDTCAQSFAFAKQRGILVQSRRDRLEFFRMSATQSYWIPVASLAIQLPCGYHVKGVWCDAALRTVILASDVTVMVMELQWSAAANSTVGGPADAYRIKKVLPRLTKSVLGTADCAFSDDGKHAYVLAACELLHVSLDVEGAVADEGKQRKQRFKKAPEPLVLSTTLMQVFHTATLVPEVGLTLAGPTGAVCFKLHPDDGTILNATEPIPLTKTSTELVSKQGVALLHSERYQNITAAPSSPEGLLLPESMPHDVRIVSSHSEATEGADGETSSLSSSPCLFGAFSKGLVRVTDKNWKMIHRGTTVQAFPLEGSNTILSLERNIEGSVEALPSCWKVRRFAN